jgi:L,D-transpeptidase catalytic domain
VRTRRLNWIAPRLAGLAAVVVAFGVAAPSALAAPDCREGRAGASTVGKPTAATAWRAGLVARTRVWRSVPKPGGKSRDSIVPNDATWLLVTRAARDRKGRCWLRVRLPSRPNHAAGWIRAKDVWLRSTPWRIVVSRSARTISLYREGRRVRRFRVVIGAAPTPTPEGLFSIVEVWRWNPADFLGSYILPLTAHSGVLQEFGGGDGRVGIHGRGGASLFDPLGGAHSHGCIRLSNGAITWIVRKVGTSGLPGIPVRVR